MEQIKGLYDNNGISREIKRTTLKQTFSKIHDYLYANSNISRNERLGQEFIKIILTKHFDEKNDNKIFDEKNYINFGEQFPKKLRDFYNTNVMPILIEHEILSDKDTLSLDDKSLIYIGLELSLINFSDSPIDSLGAAFEVFSEGKLAGDQGQFFTPYLMIKTCVEILKPNEETLILDPACGSAGFLNYAIRWLVKSNSKSDLSKKFKQNIFGIDKDQDLSKIAKSFALLIGSNPKNFHNLDSLKILIDDERLKEFDFRKKYLGKIDIILTNPPFGSKIKIKDNEILEQYDLGHIWKYDKSEERWVKKREVQETEPQILFIELCIKLLKDGGKMAIVLPQGIFGNPTDKNIRDYILSKGKILAVVDCPHDSFMPHTHTKTSILFFEKSKMDENHKIFMGIVDNCGHDSRGTLVLDNDGKIKEDFSKIINSYELHTKNQLNEDKKNYTLLNSELLDSVLTPSYYDIELLSHVNSKSKETNYKLVTLGELEQQGHISIKNVPTSSSKQLYGTEGVPFIRTTDIGNGEVICPTTHSVPIEVYTKYRYIQDLREFDILFVKDGTYRIGYTAMLFKNDLKSLVQSHFKLIRVNPESNLLTPFLLFQLLQSEIIKRQIKTNTFTQATLSSIGNRIYNLKIPIPIHEKERNEISLAAKESLIKRNSYREKLFNESNN